MADGTREPGPAARALSAQAQYPGRLPLTTPPPPPIPRGSEAPDRASTFQHRRGLHHLPWGGGGRLEGRTAKVISKVVGRTCGAAASPSACETRSTCRGLKPSCPPRSAAPPRPASGLCRPSAGPQVPGGRLARHSSYASGRLGPAGQGNPRPRAFAPSLSRPSGRLGHALLLE